MNEQPPIQPQRERLTKIFEFLKAYTELRYPPVRSIDEQVRVLWLKDMPQHPSAEVFIRNNHKAENESEDADIVV